MPVSTGQIRPISVLLILLSLLPAASVSASSTHTVQCGFLPTDEAAKAVRHNLESAGFAPVWIEQTKEGYSVLTGRCANFTDAYLLQESLRSHGFPDAFTRMLRSEERKAEPPSVSTPDDPLVLPPIQTTQTFAPVSESFEPSERAEASKLKDALSRKDWNGIRAESESLANSLPDTDALKAWAMNHAAAAAVRDERATMPSLPGMLQVARGEVAARSQEQIEARFMAADSWHYYFPNPLRAYRAYKEILQEHADNPAVVARAKVEIAACLLELAQREKATFEEARAACRDILDTVSPEFIRAHAVADLMFCESFIFEGDSQRGLDELTSFEERHPGQVREIGMARLQRADALANLKRVDEAIESYFSVIDMDFERPEDFFYFEGKVWNLKFKAAYRIEGLARWHGKPDIAEAISPVTSEQAKITDEMNLRDEFRVPFPHKFYEERKASR